MYHLTALVFIYHFTAQNDEHYGLVLKLLFYVPAHSGQHPLKHHAEINKISCQIFTGKPLIIVAERTAHFLL